MRVAGVFIAGLAVQLATVGNDRLRGQPVVIGGSPFDDNPVLDVSPEAMTCGIKVGMPLRQAYSLCPEATFLPSNRAACEKTFAEVLDILDGFSPVVERDKLGCACLDVTGVGSETDTARQILKSILAGTGLSASAGTSAGKFFSRVAAVTSTPENAVVISPGDERNFIAPFSIEFLPCPAETIERLYLLGIRYIGHLTGFPRDALIAQFGTDGRVMRELACGTDPSPLIPRQKPVFVAALLELYPPAAGYPEVLKSCESRLESLLRDVKAQGKLCREVLIRLGFESGPSRDKALPFKDATASPSAITNRIKAWLECHTFPAPVTSVELRLLLAAETGKRLSLWQRGGETRDDIGRLVEKLRTRFGYQPLKKIEEVDPAAIFPERRTRLVEAGDRE